jgi:hypothetical protein
MNEYDSPNYAEFTYEKKNEGKVRLARTLMICGYVLYLVAFFLVCYLTRVIPVFAIAPLTLWIIIFFTWKLVKYDCYFEFKAGMLELGTVKVNKKGNRRKNPTVTIHVKEALSATVYDSLFDDLKTVDKIYDLSESQHSDKRILIIFEQNGDRCAAIFEGTSKVANLIASFCEKGKSLKGKQLHG